MPSDAAPARQHPPQIRSRRRSRMRVAAPGARHCSPVLDGRGRGAFREHVPSPVMNRTWTRPLIGAVALLFGVAACGGGGSGGSATTRVGELRAAGDKLAAGPYKVDFTVEYFDLYAWTWSGT